MSRRPSRLALVLGSLLPVAAILAGRVARHRPAPRPAAGGGLEILHLAFEDHRRPGSGGGGVRTHEINRRLAQRHQITVVTTRFPGARRRVEDGVNYRPMGLPLGYFGSILTYHLCTPVLLFWTRADLVVEDFAAPMSSMLVPLWTRQRTLAVVQWLFAGETSRRYRVPFYLAETFGVRLHHNFVAVSDYMATEIRARNGRARIDVIPGGVKGPAAIEPVADLSPAGIVYLGRLQADAKGLDLLLEALAVLADGNPEVRLTVADDGPYRDQLKALTARLGLADRVTFVGRTEGDAKWELLRRASVVVVPSRFESFGLVVVEAFAAGTPVVGFAIPALRELVGDDCGILVEPFDVPALAAALGRVLDDPQLARRMGEAGRVRSARYSWEDAAAAQEKAYLAAVEPD